MIERYTLPEMGSVWSEESKLKTWLDIELAVCRAYAKKGLIPQECLRTIEEKAGFDVERVKELEKTLKHDVIAFLTDVSERVGPDSRYIHVGMTSSDILDTSLALQMKKAGEMILKRLFTLRDLLKGKALEYKDTLMMGRSHGVHAEPITFGLKLALWYEEIKRSISRLEACMPRIAMGQISGAVGTYALIDPEIEIMVCEELGLQPASISNQVLQRDNHAEYMTVLGVLAGSLEKFATEIRNLHRTEIKEVEEYFSPGQKGSSAMPHKKNPITCERIAGLSRVIRSNAVAAMENIPLWHERDITHSSVERIIIPDSMILTDYILSLFIQVMENLVVNPERMKENIQMSQGTIFSQPVLIALTKRGMTREEAYTIVQENALSDAGGGCDFQTAIKNDKRVRNFLTSEEIEACFDMHQFLRHVDHIFSRVGII